MIVAGVGFRRDTPAEEIERAVRLALGLFRLAPERLDAGIDVARISGQVKASSIKKISEVVASHPDESIAIIRSWLAEEPSDRAA